MAMAFAKEEKGGKGYSYGGLVMCCHPAATLLLGMRGSGHAAKKLCHLAATLLFRRLQHGMGESRNQVNVYTSAPKSKASAWASYKALAEASPPCTCKACDNVLAAGACVHAAEIKEALKGLKRHLRVLQGSSAL
jgi:hypothetical protein